jgi:hypothetical protein
VKGEAGYSRRMTGQISPDGRSQWDGEQWQAIPPPPKARLTAHNYFQITLIALTVVVVLAWLSTR